MSKSGLGGEPIDQILVVHAAPVEAPFADAETVFELGVGKAAAAASLQALLLEQERRQRRVGAVVLCGLAGAYPDRHRPSASPVRCAGVCLVGSDVLADEGVETEHGFVDLGAPAFGRTQALVDTGPFVASARLLAAASSILAVPVVRGATVSSCSGSEAASLRLCERTRADVETMEGAAVAFVCRRREVPWLQVRAISNWTGDRDRAGWNIGAAVDALRAAVRRLLSLD